MTYLKNYTNKNTVTYLSGKIAEIETSNELHELKIFGHGVQISANTEAITAAAGILATTASNTAITPRY